MSFISPRLGVCAVGVVCACTFTNSRVSLRERRRGRGGLEKGKQERAVDGWRGDRSGQDGAPGRRGAACARPRGPRGSSFCVLDGAGRTATSFGGSPPPVGMAGMCSAASFGQRPAPRGQVLSASRVHPQPRVLVSPLNGVNVTKCAGK